MTAKEKLANAIVIQAADDYREALKNLKKSPNNTTSKIIISECEIFFRSSWYGKLTGIDGEYLIKKLKDEVKNQ